MLLRFSPYVWAKMLFLRDIGDTEVSFLGVTPNELSLVEELVLIPQKCTGATTNMQEQGLADFQLDMLERGLEPRHFMRVWCHTHPGNSVTPSYTDENTFKEVFGPCDWAIMFILGTEGATSCRFSYRYGPGGFGGGGQQEISCEVDWKADFKERNEAAWKEEYEKNVEKISYANKWQSWNKTSQFGSKDSTSEATKTSDVVSGVSGSKYHSATHILNPKTGIWEPKGSDHGGRRLIGFREETYDEPVKELSKREKKYLAKHGSLKGFIPPKNDGRKKSEVVEQIELLPFPEEEERTSSAPRMIKLEKLEADRNLLGDIETMSDEEAACDLLEEAIDDIQNEIEALEANRDLLEKIQLENIRVEKKPNSSIEAKLDEVNHRLAELEYELYVASGSLDELDITDDATVLEIPAKDEQSDAAWLDEAAAEWMAQEIKNNQQQMDQELQSIPDIQVVDDSDDTIIGKWPMDQDEYYYNYSY